MQGDNQARQQGSEPQQIEERDQLLLSQLQASLEAEQHKSEEYLDMFRRSQADFINYRRRISQEQAEGSINAQIALLRRILPTLDDLGRALSATPEELNDHPWVQGMYLVEKRLTKTLEELGIHQVGRDGDTFDPRWHEAVAMDTSPDAPEGTILHVAQPGYMLGERIIRPAQVVVAGAMTPSGS